MSANEWGIWVVGGGDGRWAGYADGRVRSFPTREQAAEVAAKWSGAEHLDRYEARPLPPRVERQKGKSPCAK